MNLRLNPLFRLMRPSQYYKNTMVFLPIIFAGELPTISFYLPLLLGFLVLCCVSSVNYIGNDIRDTENDRMHPEKKGRPLASGLITKMQAMLLASFLFLGSLMLLVLIPFTGTEVFQIEFYGLFILCVVAVFATSQLYTLYFKKVIFADVILIAVNYVWRASAGAFLINVWPSPWLIVLVFLFALFLALGKRRGDLLFLGENAFKHREVFRGYSEELLDSSISIVSATMLVSYALYTIEKLSILSKNGEILVLTVPIMTFAVFRYLFLVHSGNKVPRNPEMAFFDRQLIISGFLILLMIVTVLYFLN